MKLGGLVVVASNAGGAWTPIGDITTTMLYIGGQVCWTTDETALCEVAWILYGYYNIYGTHGDICIFNMYILSSNDLRQVGDRWLFHLSQVINFFPIFFWPETFPSHQPKLTPSQDLIVSEKTAVRFSESHMWWVSRKHDRTWHGSCRSQVHMQNCIALLLLLST